MKQKIFWCLFIGTTITALLLCNIVQAQDTTKVTPSVVYNDIKHGLNVNAPKLEQAITSIAKSLKVTADNVWNILVKQQKVWSYCFLLLTLSALTNWYFWYKKNFITFNEKNSYKTIKKTKIQNINPKYDRYGSEPKYLDTVEELELLQPNISYSMSLFKYFHLGICIILSIFSYIHFAQMLTGFLNPEYGAMQTIAEVASSLK